MLPAHLIACFWQDLSEDLYLLELFFFWNAEEAAEQFCDAASGA